MRFLHLGIATLVAVTFTSQASAQQMIWTNGAPKTGTFLSSIYISGQVKNINVAAVSVYIWENGKKFPKKPQYTPPVDAKTGNFGDTDLGTDKRNTEYQIIIDAFDGTNTYRLSGKATSS